MDNSNNEIYYNKSILSRMYEKDTFPMIVICHEIAHEDQYGRVMLNACSEFIKKDRSYLRKYPILRKVYYDDGSVKNSYDMLIERRQLVKCNPDKKQYIDELYEYVFECYVNEESLINQMCCVFTYMMDPKEEDGFARNILLKYVLKKNPTADENIKKLIKDHAPHHYKPNE